MLLLKKIPHRCIMLQEVGKHLFKSRVLVTGGYFSQFSNSSRIFRLNKYILKLAIPFIFGNFFIFYVLDSKPSIASAAMSRGYFFRFPVFFILNKSQTLCRGPTLQFLTPSYQTILQTHTSWPLLCIIAPFPQFLSCASNILPHIPL